MTKKKKFLELEKTFAWPSLFSYHKQCQASIDKCVVFLPQNIFPVRLCLKDSANAFLYFDGSFSSQIYTFPLSICVHFVSINRILRQEVVGFIVFYEEACPV